MYMTLRSVGRLVHQQVHVHLLILHQRRSKLRCSSLLLSAASERKAHSSGGCIPDREAAARLVPLNSDRTCKARVVAKKPMDLRPSSANPLNLPPLDSIGLLRPWWKGKELGKCAGRRGCGLEGGEKMICRSWSLLSSTAVVWSGAAAAGFAGIFLFGGKEMLQDYLCREGERLRRQDRAMVTSDKEMNVVDASAML